MHLNNVTVAEVETVGCWSTKLPIISPRLKRGKNTPRSTLTIQESSSRQVRYFLYRKCTRRGGVSLLLTRPVIPVAHKIQRWHGSCYLSWIQKSMPRR